MDVSTASTTPSTSTETPSAAPATSAPSQSVTPGQRPTMAEAFASDAAPVSTESTTQPEGATTPPVTTPDPNAITPAPQGPIPFTVHKTALENARTKGGEEAVAQYRQQYGWAEQVPRETLDRMSGIANLMTSNPPEFLATYFAEAANHPQHGAAVRSWAAKTLASKSAAAVDLSPDVIVQDAAGNEAARTFSADRVQAIVQHAVQDAIGKEIAPLKQESDQRKAESQQRATEARQAEVAKQLEAQADTVLADLADLLDVTDDTPKAQKDALYGELATLLDSDPSLTPHRAAMQVRKTRITPGLQGKAQQQVLDDLHTKAASQGMNPGRAAVAPTHRPSSFHDKSLQW